MKRSTKFGVVLSKLVVLHHFCIDTCCMGTLQGNGRHPQRLSGVFNSAGFLGYLPKLVEVFMGISESSWITRQI